MTIFVAPMTIGHCGHCQNTQGKQADYLNCGAHPRCQSYFIHNFLPERVFLLFSF
jgi:hypothetical protein